MAKKKTARMNWEDTVDAMKPAKSRKKAAKKAIKKKGKR